MMSEDDKHPVSPQSALDDYFADMFATSAEDPLKKLSSQKGREVNTRISGQDQYAFSTSGQDQKTIVPKPKLKPKKKTHQLLEPKFDEPEPIVGKISPLIIPAAFPKLAPCLEAVKVDTKLPAQTKPKIDAKTALTLLEKQKSKLSIAQRQRLEEKLKHLSQLKQKQISETKPSQAMQTTLQAETLELKPEVSTEVIVKNAVAQKVIVDTDTKPETTKAALNQNIVKPSQASITTAVHKPELELTKNTLPEWTNSRFECLIFSVAGLKLAVPLISLGAIYKIERELTPLVGRANWFMGLYHHLDRNVRVIDTAQWVMPERCSEDVRNAYKFIIRLGGNDWGMACDAVHQSIQLYPDQVKWRTERTKRAWLFGTVIEHMCALIDADSLSTLLNQQGTKNPRIFS